MPNYLSFHRSLTDELHALKDRIRNLSSHWQTDGEYKEAALRTVLRRHLPASMVVGRGFVVTEHKTSTQLDILIADGNRPTLFRDGDLMFVTPDCVRAVVEVKTKLKNASALKDCAANLAAAGKLCKCTGPRKPWFGIFSYEGPLQDAASLLDAVEAAFENTQVPINCIAYGKNRFVRLWETGEYEQKGDTRRLSKDKWCAYELENLASAYFVGNLVDALTEGNNEDSSFAWFPLTDGKIVHKIDERILDWRIE